VKNVWIAFALALVCVPALDAQTAFGRPTLLRNVGIDQRMGAQLPLDLAFQDDQDRPVTLRRYTGKPIVLALVYYRCPSLCDMVLNGVVHSLRALKLTAGEDYDVVAISFDPRENSELARDKKASYVKVYGRNGSADGFHFLTGREASIKQLADSAGFHYAYDAASGQYAHPSAMMIVTPEGRLSRYFYGIEYPARDVKLGLIDASGGKIGSAVDQMQLFCFHYDPSTGKYGLLIMKVLRLGGILTLVLLGGGVLAMVRKGRT
jgi:protein SCO1/2